MLNWIYHINRWYDGLEVNRPILRFLLAVVPLLSASTLLYVSPPQSAGIFAGAFILGVMIMLRTFPIFFPQKD